MHCCRGSPSLPRISFIHGARQTFQITEDRPVHCHLAHGVGGEFLGAGSTTGAEEWTGGESGAVDVLVDGLCRDGIEHR